LSRSIWTLGHSRHSIERFIELARRHGISLIADVRGQPFSRFNPQFNRERFRTALAAAGIDYAWHGQSLSGRPTEPFLRTAGGEVDWDAVRAWPAFKAEIGTVYAGAGSHATAVVCAEEDPLRCHRRFLVSPALQDMGAEILHIRGNDEIEDEPAIAARACPKAASGQRELF